ncbi:unnamed protein product [Cercospora beticola]|nr:unnamed protein product [Cercospora beticola]
MRLLSIASASLALFSSTTLAACPYQNSGHAASYHGYNAPHAKRDISVSLTSKTGNTSTPRPDGKKGTLMFNRLSPRSSVLYIANSDGTNARRLLSNSSAVFEYHATFSPDGKYIIYTSEKRGAGQADLYRVRVNGTGIEELVATDAVDDQGVLSPDGNWLAYVSSGNGWKANIWVKDLETGETRNLTNTASVKGVSWSPDGYFKPAWSPDGQWIAFSSDRNTGWYSHSDGTAWENTQELSIYAIRPDGTDFRLVATKPGYALGSPKWSSDGRRIVYYEMERTQTYNARSAGLWNDAANQIWSVDFETGETRQETETNVLKVSPQYVSDELGIGYFVKSHADVAGIYYTNKANATVTFRTLQMPFNNPSWSPDGKQVVFEVLNREPPNPSHKPFSPDPEWIYAIGRQFPTTSPDGEKIAFPDPFRENVVIANVSDLHHADNEDLKNITIPAAGPIRNLTNNLQAPLEVIQPAWSPDGEWIAFGAGGYFQQRRQHAAAIYRVKADNSSLPERLTVLRNNSGFPSYSHDGNSIVYRQWGPPGSAGYGLYVYDIAKNVTTQLTEGTMSDNFPSFSPDGSRIVFTRRMNVTNFDICTIKPDGTDLQVLTDSAANDAHGVWTYDGRIVYSSGASGWKAEAATYDQAEQPYGQLWIMDADGSNKYQIADSLWEDAMPIYLPGVYL